MHPATPLRPAVFSDVEGTLIRISFPRTYFEQARTLGFVPLGNQIRAGVLTLASKPFSSKSRIGRILRYLAMTNAMRGLVMSMNAPVMEKVLPLLQAAFKPDPLARIRAYEATGMPVILLSAAFESALQVFAAAQGWRGEGTRFIIEGDRFTGRAETPLSGEAKAVRARAVASEMGIDLARSVGFGDTVSDVPFLSLMGTVFVVDPDPDLITVATARGWTVITTSAPVSP